MFGGSITLGTDNGGNAFPFGGSVGAGTRYQEAYASADFSGPISITITTDINLLSDTDFDANLGVDNTLFQTVALSGPAPAELSFTGGPFFYSPANGNLLLDFTISDSLAAKAPGSDSLPNSILHQRVFRSQERWAYWRAGWLA